MSLCLQIHPLSVDLDMFGESDPASAYSLSGHVSISVTSPYSLFEARRPARMLLQSVALTFEGQSEIFTPSTGYSSLRLCSVKRELVPCEPIEISNEGHEESGEPCVWNMIFNLPIPGWLPASTAIGMEDIGTKYGLYATARFVNLDEEQSSSWSFAAFCAPFRSRFRSADASKTINLRRFISAPKAEIAEVPNSNYLVNSTASSSKAEQLKERIPFDVLNKIQVLTSIPEYINVESSEIPLIVRLRTKDLCEEDCKKLRLTEISVDVIQNERYRYRPSPMYLARYPLPPKNMQPPNLPLLDPHPISSVYDVGLFMSSNYSEAVTRTFSLLPGNATGKYEMGENNYIFKDDAKPESIPTWYTMETDIRFVQRSPSRIDQDCVEWAGMPDLRPTSSSPLFSVTHDVTISLACTYDLDDGKVAKEVLSFKIPLTFANVAPRPAPVDLTNLVSLELLQQQTPIAAYAPTPTKPSFSLPAYSQLYDRHGERRIDYSVPLPLYTPRQASKQAAPFHHDEIMPLIDSSTNTYDNDDTGSMEKPQHIRARRLRLDSDSDSEDGDAPVAL